MPTWLLLQVQLRFNPSLRPIFPPDYRADLLPDGSNVYYGVHFVSAPSEIKPGDELAVELMVRAFPQDPCTLLQTGRKVFLKEGPSLVRAEGTITHRWEHESASTTVIELLRELADFTPQ